MQQLHAAVLNGSQIWLAGGLTGSSQGAAARATDKTAYYDLASHAWHTGPGLPFAVHHAMLVAYKNQLWLIGGFRTSSTNLEAAASNKVLILKNGHWTSGPSLHHARAAGAAVVVGNKIVVFGGRTGGKVEAEVTQTEVFDGKSWHDAPAIPFPGDHLGAVSDGTYAYAIGGRNLKSSDNNNHLQRFDPATNTWTQLTPLPVANSDMGAVYVDGQIVTFGGENAFSVFNTVRAYNVATKTWSTLPNMAQARHGMGAAVVGNTIYAIDGAHLPGHAGSTRTLQTFVPPVPAAPIRFFPSWVLGRISTFPVQQLHAAVLNGSQIWLAGGLTGSSGAAAAQATKQTEYFDTALHVWNNGPPLPFAVHHAMLVAYKNQLWLIGGFRTSSTNLEAAASNKVLILKNGHWTSGPSLHHARAAGAAVVVGEQDRRFWRADRRQGRGGGHADRGVRRQELARRPGHPVPR